MRLSVEDMIGERRGSLVATGEAWVGNGHDKHITAECDCGKTIVAHHYTFKVGGITSCGCKKGDRSRVNIKKAHAAITQDFKKSLLSNLMAFSKHAAKRHNPPVEFTLTREQYKALIDGECFYCGRDKVDYRHISGPKNSVHIGKKYECVGIDRKDSFKGYTPDNCVPCCQECNLMKRTLSVNNFISKCKIIAQRFI